MPFSINIVPHVASLDMYGAARTSTAYSLSGELVLSVSSTVPSTRPLFPSASQSSTSATPLHPEWQPTTVYISSIQLVFEGKMLLISRHSGHSSIRLCSVTKDLVQDNKPIILTNAGVGRRRGSTSSLANGEIYPDSAGTMRWTMTFDLAIPGWLPATRSFEDGTGSSYTIHAFAKFHDDYESCIAAMSKPSQESQPSTSATGLSSYLPALLPPQISSLFTRSKTRSSNATPVPIQVNRFRAPKSFNPFSRSAVLPCGDEPEDLLPPQISHATPSLFPVTLDAVETTISVPASKDENDANKRIPLEILSGIEVVAGVPENMALWEDRIPLSLRMRSANKDEINKGLTLETFDVEVEQVERFRSVPCERYVTTYPVPATAEQPPNKPLLTPHPYEAFYTLGIAPLPSAEPLQWTRTVPMVPTKKVNFRPAPITGGLELDSDWAKMDLSISVLRSIEHESPESINESNIDEDERAGRALRRKLINVDFDSPFIKVRHELKVSMKLTYIPPAAAEEVDHLSQRTYAEAQSRLASNKPSKWAKRSFAEIRRQLRVSHPACKTETLMFNIPLRLVQVPEHVEKVYKLTRELANVAASGSQPRDRSLARSSSIGGSSIASRSASPFPSSSASSVMSRSTTPALSSGGPSPLSITSALPTVDSSSYTASTCTGSLSSSLSSSLPPSHPYASLPSFGALPPYCALYHSNGHRKESADEVGWLPKYTEKTNDSEPTIVSEPDALAI